MTTKKYNKKELEELVDEDDFEEFDDEEENIEIIDKNKKMNTEKTTQYKEEKPDKYGMLAKDYIAAIIISIFFPIIGFIFFGMQIGHNNDFARKSLKGAITGIIIDIIISLIIMIIYASNL